MAITTNDKTQNNDLLDKLKYLSDRRREVLNGLLQGSTDAEIAKKLNISIATVRKHIQAICEYFGIEGQTGYRRNRRKELKIIFEKYNLTDTSIADQNSPFIYAEEVTNTEASISYFSGALPLDSPLYIRRELADDTCEKILEAVEANSNKLPLINIRGSQFSGKSSLLIQLHDFAETKLGHVSAFIDLSSEILEQNVFEDLEEFLKQFTKLIIHKFISSTKFPKKSASTIFQCKVNLSEADLLVNRWLEENWQKNISPGINCTNCIEKFLKSIHIPKTLFVDGLEKIANRKIEFPFLTLLRNWNQSKMTKIEKHNDVIWFSIVTLYSTRLQDKFISPLENVGKKIYLPELNQKQLSLLANKYGLNWAPVDYNIIMLRELIGGQPMLANWAFDKISKEQITVEELKNYVINTEPTDDNVINFLFKSIKNLGENREVLNFIKNLVQNKRDKESIENYILDKLERSGVIKFEENRWQISCEIYRELCLRYFSRYC